MKIFFDWVWLACVVLIIVLMIRLNVRMDQRLKADTARHVKRVGDQEQMLTTLQDAADHLKESVLASLWLRHAAYRADEETPPLTVKCIECGDIVGVADGVEDIYAVAHSHVVEKYDELVRDVKRPGFVPAGTP